MERHALIVYRDAQVSIDGGNVSFVGGSSSLVPLNPRTTFYELKERMYDAYRCHPSEYRLKFQCKWPVYDGWSLVDIHDDGTLSLLFGLYNKYTTVEMAVNRIRRSGSTTDEMGECSRLLCDRSPGRWDYLDEHTQQFPQENLGYSSLPYSPWVKTKGHVCYVLSFSCLILTELVSRRRFTCPNNQMSSLQLRMWTSHKLVPLKLLILLRT